MIRITTKHSAFIFLVFFPLFSGAEPLHEVRIPAVAHPSHFQGLLTRWTGMPGYHLLVWNKGDAANNALFTTEVPDSIFYQKIAQLGAKPSNTLSLDMWEQRKNPDHLAPDTHLEGDKIEVLIQLDNQKKPIPLHDLLKDTGGKGFDFRFGGHLQNQKIWHSGCNICLFSCPGSKVGNAAYTIRDYVQGQTQFRLKENHPLQEGTKVTFIFHLLKQETTNQ